MCVCTYIYMLQSNVFHISETGNYPTIMPTQARSTATFRISIHSVVK